MAGSFRALKLRQVLPKELTPIEHPSAAHVKQVHSQHTVLIVIAKHIGIIAFSRGNALLFLQLLDG